MIAYVSNAGWIDTNTADGLRKCIAAEFSTIHVFHLRGNQRTSGDRSKREGGKIFGSGSRTPVAITLLVKNPKASEQGRIKFHDIGDYLTRDQKLAIIAEFRSIGGIERKEGWNTITPDEHGDWLAQREKSFESFIVLGDKKGNAVKLFENFSQGILTARDSWTYNGNKTSLASNMERMIGFYNTELDLFNSAFPNVDRKTREKEIDAFIDTDSSKISWTGALKGNLAKGKSFSFDNRSLAPSLYRPFMRQWCYYSRDLNERVYQMPRIFPIGQPAVENLVIHLTGVGAKDFSALMIILPPSYDHMEKGQCFPRYLYDEEATGDDRQQDMLATKAAKAGRQRRDAITNEGLTHFQAAYPNENITKDDLFYYVYGLLHSEDYRSRYADNLSKELPRIPAVKNAADFWAFAAAGRRLGCLHCNYEKAEPYQVVFSSGDTSLAAPADPTSFYRVEKMKFAGKRQNLDITTVIYNSNITITGIPLGAYEYVVNGKPALEWVMERQCVKTDKASGIINDANCYAIETAGDPAYPLKLFQRVITVSLETMKIVKALPPLGELS